MIWNRFSFVAWNVWNILGLTNSVTTPNKKNNGNTRLISFCIVAFNDSNCKHTDASGPVLQIVESSPSEKPRK